MRSAVLRWLGVATAALLAAVPVGWALDLGAGVPVVGVDVGAALPISDFRRTADPGGAIAPYVGYQIGETFAVTPIISGQYAAFPTSFPSGDDVTGVITSQGGVKLSLFDDKKEVYFKAQGGWYWYTSGVRRDNGEGFSLAGGFNYEIARGTSLGVYIRRDEANMIGDPLDDDSRMTFLVTGIGVQHRFLPPPPPPPAPPVVAEAPPPPPPAPPVKKKIVLRGVHFDFDKSVIRPDARPILDEAARTLGEEKDVDVVVEGHTDGIGTEEYNLRLSERRANAVRDYLIEQGVAANRLTVKGFGKANPVASNATPEGRAQNRRVELRVTGE